MSTQRESRVRVGPGYSVQQQTSPAPSVALQGRAAPGVRLPRATGLEGLADALGGFFRTGAQAVEALGQIEQADKIHAVRMENEELALRGQADRLRGQAPDADAAGRMSYIDAYARTNANVMASELGDKFKRAVNDKPLDGSFDVDAFRREFVENEVGQGTGDDLFDAPLLAQVNAQIERVADSFKAKQSEVTRKNGVVALQSELEGFLQDAQGVNVDRLNDAYSRGLALFQGDRATLNQWFTATMAGVARNPGQADTILKAMDAPLVGGRSFREQFPQVYTELSARLLDRLNTLQTLEAVQTHTNFVGEAQTRLAQATGPGDVLRLMADYEDRIFRRYGGIRERGAFHAMLRERMDSMVDQKVVSNAVLRHLVGAGQIGADSTALGKPEQSVIDEGFDRAVQQLAQMQGASLATVRTEFGFGAVDPLGDAPTAQFVGQQIDKLNGVSANVKRSINLSITNLNDPRRASTAYALVSRVFDSRGEAAGAAALDWLLDDQGKTFFYAMRSAAESGVAPEQFLSSLKQQPELLKLVADARRTGRIDWPALTGTTQEARKIQADVDAQAAKHLGKLTGWFGDDVVFGSTQLQAEFRNEVAMQLALQRTRTTSPDLDDATKRAAQKFAGRFMLVPGEKGVVSALPNVFGRSGEIAKSPTGTPIVAPVPLKNPVTGEQENPAETWRTDVRTLSRALPGLAGEDADRVHLRQVSDTATTGLFEVRRGDGMPMVFAGGQEVAMQIGHEDRRGGVRKQIVRIPEDYTEAVKALQRVLPPGFYVADLGLQNGVRAFGVRYGFRYATNPADAAALGEHNTAKNKTDAARRNRTDVAPYLAP